MKKNYIAPATYCVRVNVTNMLATSFLQSTASPEGTEDSGADLGVKASHYDVWDDDWSK